MRRYRHYVIPHLLALFLGIAMVLSSSPGESLFTYGWVLVAVSALLSLGYLTFFRRSPVKASQDEND
ncbi:hypothetical protein [Serinicoccus hydrothermalis]|uniref:hypothetical protein n=1 Tax=Serinicoccus hydrothermalis TaxID=1758689 RepID=UPI00082E4056|nr:hypothetical protein [Serinicoccus hydrothermalis]